MQVCEGLTSHLPRKLMRCYLFISTGGPGASCLPSPQQSHPCSPAELLPRFCSLTTRGPQDRLTPAPVVAMQPLARRDKGPGTWDLGMLSCLCMCQELSP